MFVGFLFRVVSIADTMPILSTSSSALVSSVH